MKTVVGVLSADPGRTVDRYPGVTCFDVSGGRLKAIIAGIRWCDILVVGGGELVQDVSSLLYSSFNLMPLFIAALMRKKAFAWAVGIGQQGELSVLTPLLTKMALKTCSGITVRDRGSFNVLYRLGFREPDLMLVSDCGLTLSEEPCSHSSSNTLGAAPRDVSNRSRKLLPLELRKKLGIYREADPLPAADAWAELLDRHIDKHGSDVVLFPFHIGTLSNDDYSFCDLVKSRMVHAAQVSMADPEDSVEFVRLISTCRVLVTTPLHGAIMAVATGTVPVSVSYSSKCTRFMEQAHLEEFAPDGIAGIPGDKATFSVEKAWTGSEALEKKMCRVRKNLVRRADMTAEHFRKTFGI